MPRDGFGREIDYLRISLTDRCNQRCVYCMPAGGIVFAPPAEQLTAAELGLVVRAAVAAGFRKFRLTGGEPTFSRARGAWPTSRALTHFRQLSVGTLAIFGS